MSAFPASPTNGQTVTVNGVVYTYNSTKTAWSVTSSGGSLLTASSLSVSGNITAGNLVGAVATTATTAGTVTTAAQPNITSIGTLSSLTISGTTTASHINPSSTNTVDLGSSGVRWRNIYTNDFHLSNGIGDYTIVEGEDDLFLYNNKNGKVYKFVIQEVDPNIAPAKAKTE